MSGDQRTAAWLTEGYHVCPAWCGGFHSTSDDYDDRVHQGPMVAVTLTADEVDPGEDPGYPRPGAEGLLHLNLCLVQHYREEWPRIWVGRGGSRKGFYVTPGEAEELASRLRDLVADDEQSRREAPEREERAEREREAARSSRPITEGG